MLHETDVAKQRVLADINGGSAPPAVIGGKPSFPLGRASDILASASRRSVRVDH
jgi:hypothetical protein